jgi:putative membrane protein
MSEGSEGRPPDYWPKIVVSDDTRRVAVPMPSVAAEDVPLPRRRSPWRWAIGGVLLLLLTGLVVDALGWVMSAFALGTGLGVAAAALLALGIAGPLYWLAFELRGFARLRALDELQVRAAAELDREQALRLVEESTTLLPTRAGVAAFRAALAPHHDGRTVLNLARGELMRPVDRMATVLVRRAALQSAAMTTLSPTALIDTLLFVARALRLLRDVAELYGQRPGIAGMRHLLGRVAREAATLGAAELVLQGAAAEVGGSLLSKLFTGLGGGALAGQRMARLGLLAMRVCRPIPFLESEMPSLVSLLETSRPE